MHESLYKFSALTWTLSHVTLASFPGRFFFSVQLETDRPGVEANVTPNNINALSL